MTVRKLHMLADKPGKKKGKKNPPKRRQKINFGQLKNPLSCSRTVLNIFIELSESCKLISVQICLHLLMNAKNLQCKWPLQSCCVKTRTYGHVPQSWCGTGKHLGISPTCLSSPRTACTHWDGPIHTPPVPRVEDGGFGSSLCTDEWTEEIRWFQEEKCPLELHLRKGGAP